MNNDTNEVIVYTDEKGLVIDQESITIFTLKVGDFVKRVINDKNYYYSIIKIINVREPDVCFTHIAFMSEVPESDSIYDLLEYIL